LIHREEDIGEPVWVSLLVLLEMEWVLRSGYGLAKPDIATAFSFLLQTAEVVFEDEPPVEHALYIWKDSPAEFADCLTKSCALIQNRVFPQPVQAEERGAGTSSSAELSDRR
jgi:predicted nucleic-acid-binding protein